MFNKKLLVTTEFQHTAVDNNLKTFQLSYFLLKSENTVPAKENTYGVEIIKTWNDNGNEMQEKASFAPLYSNEGEATNFIKLVAEKMVTPMTLGYIVEDTFC